jgi:hypothetical protein
MSGGSRRTMAFTNDTGYPVLIKGINERGRVIFELYGIDDGRTVELREARVENIVKGGTWLEYSDALAPGQRRKKQDRYDSFDSWVSRIVRDAQGNVIHEDTFVSHYKKLDAITLVGRYPGDPPAGTRIRPENYPGAPKPPTDPPDPPEPGDPGDPGDPPADFNVSFTAVQQANTLDVKFTGQPKGAQSYSWSFGSTKRTTTATFASAGQYDVTLTVTKDGVSKSKTMTVTVTAVEDPPSPEPEPDGEPPDEEPPPQS